MFSTTQQIAIKEKIELLRRFKDGSLSKDKLIEIITQRRVKWIKSNLRRMLIKYEVLPLHEMAYRIVFFDHMGINPEHSEMIEISPKKIRINSSNFCPYLEACTELKLETNFICKEIGESPIEKMLKVISPNLKFSRNYENIRPYNSDFCEEYFEITNS